MADGLHEPFAVAGLASAREHPFSSFPSFLFLAPLSLITSLLPVPIYLVPRVSIRSSYLISSHTTLLPSLMSPIPRETKRRGKEKTDRKSKEKNPWGQEDLHIRPRQPVEGVEAEARVLDEHGPAHEVGGDAALLARHVLERPLDLGQVERLAAHGDARGLEDGAHLGQLVRVAGDEVDLVPRRRCRCRCRCCRHCRVLSLFLYISNYPFLGKEL